MFIRKVTMSDILWWAATETTYRLFFFGRLAGFTWIPYICCHYLNNLIFINSNSMFEHARTHPNIVLSAVYIASNLFFTCMISCSNAISPRVSIDLFLSVAHQKKKKNRKQITRVWNMNTKYANIHMWNTVYYFPHMLIYNLHTFPSSHPFPSDDVVCECVSSAQLIG